MKSGFTKGSWSCLLLVLCMALAGCGGGGSDSAGSAPSAKVPASPAGITAVGGINEVTLTWDAVSGADSYNIYWSDQPGVTPATGTKISAAVSPYTHKGLYISQTYYYVVTAVNAAGESIASTQASTVSTGNGASLYATNCAGCHGADVAATTIKNGTVPNIKAAIAANTGGMGSLSSLTDDDINAIAVILPCH
jgi:mono/diheme cytochrome c family protein